MRARHLISLLLSGIVSTLAVGCVAGSDDGSGANEEDLTESAAKVDVIFSPAPSVDQSHLARIAAEIDAAKYSVDIAIYSYSDANITARLAAAAQRGVKIRVIYEVGGEDSRSSHPDTTTSGKLEAAGADVRYVNKIMHHKVMIVDGPRDVLARAKTARLFSGSANWANSAAMRFNENTLIYNNAPALALRFQREFDLMWTHTKDFVSKPFQQELSTSTITDESIPASTTETVYFTSSNFTVRNTTFSSLDKNTVSDALVAGINGATKSIHLASTHVRSRPVAEALLAKKLASPELDIRVYIDNQEFISKSSNDYQVTNLNTCLSHATTDKQKAACNDNGYLFSYDLAKAGIDLRFKTYMYRWDATLAPQMHDKYMVIDGTTLYSGSYNLSDNSEHGTFENMVVFQGVEHKPLVTAFEGDFESMWKTGRDEHRLETLLDKVEHAPTIPLVFDPIALTFDEVTNLKDAIRTNCTAADSTAFRQNTAAHQTCAR